MPRQFNINGQEQRVSLFLDETGEPAAQQRDSSRLKNKDMFSIS